MINRKIHKLDATGKTIGRLATQISIILRGKNKPNFEPHLDQGDIVEVENIKNINFTGKKLEQKKYYSYSGYPGGLKTTKMNDLFKKNPGEILLRAVNEMLPPNRLRKIIIKRLIIK
jgi:large subunit ribosomal protein L13